MFKIDVVVVLFFTLQFYDVLKAFVQKAKV